MPDDDFAELLRAHIEETLSRMSDVDYAALTARVRPPADPTPDETPPKGNVIRSVGQSPTQPTPEDHLTALEREGRWQEAHAIKTAQLNRLIREQNRGW